jgi:hypothetical protein
MCDAVLQRPLRSPYPEGNGANGRVPADAGRRASLSVVIPATDAPVTLERSLEALRASADPPDEIIVVHGPPGQGPAGARNAGAIVAKGSVVVFVDSDVLVHPDAIGRIRSAFEEDAGLTAIFGSYDDRPSEHGTVSTFRNMLHHYVHHSAPGPATTFWAGLGGVRREAFMHVDGFDDERYRVPSVEDIDLGLRLSAAGATIRLDPRILGTHLKHWRLGMMVMTDIAHRGVPWTSMVLARGAPAARLNLRGRHLLGAAAFTAGLVTAVAGRPRVLSLLAAAYFGTNARFYALLHRRAGPRGALAGAALLGVHNAASLVSAPIGAVAFLRRRRRGTTERARRSLDGRCDAPGVMPSVNGSGANGDGANHTIEVLQRSAVA